MHLLRDDGLWPQDELLAAGMARVYSFRDNCRLIGEMLAQELSTRAAQLGTWAAPYYAARTPEGVVEDIGTFQFDVEGEDIHTLEAHIMRHQLQLPKW